LSNTCGNLLNKQLEKAMKTITRRKLTQNIGIATGVGLLAPGLAVAAPATPAQVEGPFHPVVAQKDTDLDLTLIQGHTEPALGEVILVRGRVLNSQGQPLANALVDVWQANDDGRYSHPKDPNTAPLDANFQGWGLINTDAQGRYAFKTIKPGAYPLSFLGEDGWRCRHIHFKVSQPGYEEIITQMYFQGDPLIEQDLEVAKAPPELRHLLIVDQQTDASSGLPLFDFDLILATAGWVVGGRINGRMNGRMNSTGSPRPYG
jgi:protocatechuate 3,4-dioxygenase beta subunit